MTTPANFSRRQFIKTSVAAAAALPMTSSKSSANIAALKNDRPNIGCIGVGGRGTHVSKWAQEFGDIVAVCDADLNHAEQFKAKNAPKADLYQDYRQVLGRKDIDVIIQATPDHWHTKINIDACLAGKDVYGEKPLTLTIDEGKQLRDVVKKTGRVFQTGTQQRSDKLFQTAVELVRNGRLGKLKQIWVALPYYSTKGGPFAAEPVPKSLDWDLYLGQTPKHYYTHNRTHKIYRWWYEYAGGIITDWGNHHIDIAHWAMNCDLSGPIAVDARGLFPNKHQAECYNTPDRFFSRMSYASGVDVLFFSAINDKRVYGEVEPNVASTAEELDWLFGDNCPEEIRSFDRNGIMLIGDKGRLFVNRGGIYGKAAEELKENPLPEDAWRVSPSSNHMQNFFDCVKTRKTPVSSVEIEHRTVTACHLTNISIRLGKKLNWDPKKEQCINNTEANTWLQRNQREPYSTQ